MADSTQVDSGNVMYTATDDLAVVSLARTDYTTAVNVRLGDVMPRVGTVTSVIRFGGQLYIEGTRDMVVKMPDSPVTVTRALTSREVAELGSTRDVSDEDADLVTVVAGSDAPMHVVREGVSLDVDEAQWPADNAVGLELRRRSLTVDPLAVESQAQFDERMARGYAERAARRPVTDPFRRLPVHEDIAF